MAAPFISQVEVRFRHCDPAGIVFYPRYFEMINDFVEEWFDKGMGLPFHALHVERHIGTPMASVQCDFSAPSRWHERLRQVLVQRIGGASFKVLVKFEDRTDSCAGGDADDRDGGFTDDEVHAAACGSAGTHAGLSGSRGVSGGFVFLDNRMTL